MRWRDFDVVKLVGRSLPMRWRMLETSGFFNAVLRPLDTLRAEILYRMQHDCTVIYMEKVLNEQMGVPGYDRSNHIASRKIIIAPGEAPDIVCIWLITEPDPPAWLDTDNQWLFTDPEMHHNYSDFIIQTPDEFEPNENRLRSLANYYKMAGKKYKIEYI